ncbi:major facilitator superfamily domain-containing protein [Plectosphaerella plurivora]|uniref:Major facilitator superfamily domain-containing protein n=1 Tax=Plectosphaerella plurivora TaxID=936078 RepID=A0A9P9AHD2_9PEZI|nr:major facilitator superfamily domain-containing protein [Plectosphaerella plurivora]
MSAEKTSDRASPPESLLQGSQKRVESDSDSPRDIEARVVKAKGDIVFAGGASDRLYEPIPEYEGRHRYDPTAEWTEEEEKKLVKKLDWRICSWVCVMFFALQLDRGNINQALSDDMLTDIGLTTNQYNYGMTIFYISFLLAELPSQMVSKKLGPDVWVPTQMIGWSLVAASQAFIKGQTGFYVTRALLGLCEGGFIPDAILYLTYFYTSKELPIRLSYFYTSSYVTQILAAFLAAGIFQMRGLAGWHGWQWMFLLEGIATGLIGVFSFLLMPASPTQTASWFRGKDGWFSEREEIIMVNRVLRDDPAKGGMHNRQGLTLRLLYNAFSDYDLWPIYLMGFTLLMPLRPIMAYFTLNLRNLGFTTLQTNLLTVPAFTIFIFQLIFCPWGRYAVTVLIVGYPYVHSILVGLTSRNAGSVRTRTVGSAFYNMCVQTSSIIGSNVSFSSGIYRQDDAPLYRRGNRVILGIIAWNFVFAFLIKFYYIWRNKKRDAVWDGMSSEEKDTYLATTKDQGSRRLDFRFAH